MPFVMTPNEVFSLLTIKLKRETVVPFALTQAQERERELWFQQYPEALPIVLELQELVKKERPDQTPLRDYKWFIDENGRVNE